MPSYKVTAINVASFPLGEGDKVLTMFSAERGLIRAVAKGARKPGAKIAGRAEVLKVNEFLIAQGRSLDIITQAHALESFANLRSDLARLSYALYYAELTSQFGQGLSDESNEFFDCLRQALSSQSAAVIDPALLALEFELHLLHLLGYKPELNNCVVCRRVLSDSNLSVFDHDLGGIICDTCASDKRKAQKYRVAERSDSYGDGPVSSLAFTSHITPLVWKSLILASLQSSLSMKPGFSPNKNIVAAYVAGHRLMQTYIEHKAGRKMKALDLLANLT